MAHAPLQCWSWDITKLPGPIRGVFFDCYVIIDIFSRYIVGWTVAAAEDGDIAAALIGRRLFGIGIGWASRCTPTGAHSMTSKTVAQLLEDLSIGPAAAT